MDNKAREEIDNQYKWDLEALYPSVKSFESDYAVLDKLVDKVLSYEGHIMDSSDTLYDFYQDYETMIRLNIKMYIYAHLLCDTDTSNSEYQKIKMHFEKINEDIDSKLSFITPEMLNKPYDEVLKMIDSDNRLELYRFDLEKIYRYKEHTLSKELEEIITKAGNAFGTGDEVFYNFDNADIYLGNIKDENGKEVELTNSNYTKYMNSKDREVRKDAFKHMYAYFKRFKNTIAAALKGNMKENFFSSDVRKFNSPLEQSLYADNISIDVYNNLIQAVHDGLPIMYDYMKLRKKALNLDELHMYDIYVDIIESNSPDIPFEEGKQMVFEALKPLGEQYLKDLNKAFDERWIDIYPNKGKKSGAYSWGCYDSYPYLLLNYNNTVDSVSTMAHELGHSMHSYYSEKTQPYMYHEYPIFLAEIASTVNEVLLNDYMYKHAKTKEEKILYLTEFIEKVRTTIYRQTMFAEFEKIMHDKYQNNEPLTEDNFSTTYYNLNKLYYGDEVISDDDIRYEWARIPHFYTSFYVYKYATGLSSAIAIASEILKGNTIARDAYLELLASGGSDYPLELLKKAGVDMTTKEPVLKALDMCKEKLEELKNLI